MLQPENETATKTKGDALYLAVLENNDDTTLLTEYDFSRCIRSTRSQ